jgi:hypothetical protein
MTEDHNIENDKNLRGLTGSNSPFRANEDYFENFTSKLQNRIVEFEELKDLAPVLGNIPKYNPFEAPVGYFDELPSLVQERCVAQAQKAPAFAWLQVLFRSRIVVPTFLLIIAALVGIRYLSHNVTQPSEMAEEVSSFEDQLQNIDEATIVEALTADASLREETSAEDEKIMDYLLDNNLDETNPDNEL